MKNSTRVFSHAGTFMVLLGVIVLICGVGRPTAATARPDSISFGPANTVGSVDPSTVDTLSAGDLDNDGDVDLVAGDLDNHIFVWQNDDSPFAGSWLSNMAGTATADIFTLAVGDLDNDGRLDIASGSASAAAAIQVWRNDGTPFSGAWTSNNAGAPGVGVYAIALADLDNDGDLDLASASADGQVRVWQNDGTPFSGAWSPNGVGPAGGVPQALAVGDLDNDGDIDIVSGDRSNQVIAWANDGTPFSGAWTAQVALTTGDYPLSLALTDLDADGDLDLVAGCWELEDYELVIGENDGTPFAGAWIQHDLGKLDARALNIAVADFDLDGDPDVVSGSAASAAAAEVRAWENNGSPFAGLWNESAVLETGHYVYALAAADWDHDDDPDLAVSDLKLIVALPNTRALKPLGNWTPGTQPLPAPDALSVALADFDYSGDADIAAGTANSGILVWKGDGGYTWTQVTAPQLPSTGAWTGVAWGQINNANEVDLAASSEGGGLRAWLVAQDGAVWEDISSGLPTGGNYQDLTLARMNNDGLLDLVAAGKGVGVRVWQGTGGAGSPKWIYQKTVSDTLDFCDLALGHVNHDGNQDVVAANCGNNRGLPVWLGDASFGFAPVTHITATGNYAAVALGDVDNDGDADVVAAPQGGGALVWLGDGGAAWSYATTISPTLFIISLDLNDFDNDGFLDILAGLGNGGVRVWKGDGGATWADASANLATSASYYGALFGRVDGDAALDIVGAESGNSGVRVWTSAAPPPGGWTNFQPYTYPPHTWARAQQVTCTVQVADSGSGLDVSTAQYRFSRDGGGTWLGGWLSAAVSGVDGTTAPQVMTATNVLFNQDSATQNAIQFRIQNKAGLVGVSPIYYVAIDSTPPTNPSDLGSPSHTPGAWSDDNSVRFTWTNQGFDALSGIWGYSWLFNRVADERPDESAEQGAGPGDYTLWAIPDGEWYLHFMTRDRAGNWADPVHLGPYRIDTAAPTTPTLSNSSHTISGWNSDNTIFVSWDSSDEGSGIAGYSYVWHTNPTYYVDTTIDTTYNALTSDALADGRWYFHVRAIDQGGRAGPTAHFGPFGVDTTDPYGCWINVPRYCTSTCLVEWHYLDAGSGIASYDVQVREDTSGITTWHDWLVGTVLTSTVYTDTRYGLFSFHVRARDRANNLSNYDCVDQTTIEDLRATGLEVTQAIQNLANDVPLVADKATFVRLYASTARVDVAGVNARLYGTRGGAPLPGSPLAPTGGRITLQADGGDRANLDDAFYFQLPPTWRSGTVQLRGVVDPADEFPEDEWGSNEIIQTVTFQTGGDFCIVFVPVHLHPATYYIADDPDGFWDIVAMMKRLLPVRENGVGIYNDRTMYPSSHGVGWEYGLPSDFDRVLSDLWWYDFWTNDPCHDTHYWGMVDPRHLSGRWGIAYLPPGDEGSGVMDTSTLFDEHYTRWMYPKGGIVLAHELGHNFDRRHIDCGHPPNPGSYPYPDPCAIAPTDPAGYYGFVDPILDPQPKIIPPYSATPLLSYGYPQWIDDWTYRAIFNWLRSSAQAQSLALPPVWAQANEYLAVGGIISPTGQTAELRAFYRTTTPDARFVARSVQQEAGNGTYSLVLEDAGGAPLYTHTFTTTAITPYGDTPPTEIFAEVLPYHAQTARIVLKRENTELAVRLVSAHAPTVTLLSPNGGEAVADHLLISWTASDADGDDLHYTVQYSPDDGATWRSLAVDWTDITLDVAAQDVAVLPGSSQARIRVTASDGVNTAQDQSDAVFSLTRKPPRAHITEPKDGSQFTPGSVIVFKGVATDAEDGMIGEANVITWTSNLSGTLGVGTELWVSNLLTGAHRITITVADSDGDIGADAITVFVGVSPNKVYLPIVLKK